ncbi:hypothetical protein AAE478_008708 [Parahypoxylon ruwenzoriense]
MKTASWLASILIMGFTLASPLKQKMNSDNIERIKSKSIILAIWKISLKESGSPVDADEKIGNLWIPTAENPEEDIESAVTK